MSAHTPPEPDTLDANARLTGDAETLPAPAQLRSGRTGLVVADGGFSALADPDLEARYKPLAVLGRGGMGEVHLCKDARIGREVAMKLALGRTPDGEPRSSGSQERFVREARVQ